MSKMKNDEFGTIDIFRPYGWFAILRSHAIFIDNQLGARLKAGEREIVELPPGPHTVQVRMGWTKTNIVTVNVETGKNHKLLIGRKKLSGPVTYLYYTLGAVALLAGLVGMGGVSGAIILLMAPRFGKMHLHAT
jgi:hypothetical protein